MLVGANEGILRDIVGLLLAAQQPVGVAVNGRAVVLVDGDKGGFVAGTRTGEDCGIHEALLRRSAGG